MNNNSLLKRGLAEGIGTFVLVFFACGVAAITGGNFVATPIAFGLVIFIMAYTIGNISGCHINPAVSLGCLIAKRMTAKEFGIYVLSQFLGGLAGGVLMFGILKMGGVTCGNACNNAIGYKGYLSSINAGGVIGAIILEVILTLVFVYVVLAVTDEKNGTVGKKAGLIIGFALMLVHFVGVLLTGTSVNPARSFATAICDGMFNQDADALAQVAIFLAAPMGGGALAPLVYKALHGEKKREVKVEDSTPIQEVDGEKKPETETAESDNDKKD